MYVEEPRSKLEKAIGRRMPITFSIVLALIIAIYYNNVQMETAIVVLLTAIVTTLFRDVGAETAVNSTIREEAIKMKK